MKNKCKIRIGLTFIWKIFNFHLLLGPFQHLLHVLARIFNVFAKVMCRKVFFMREPAAAIWALIFFDEFWMQHLNVFTHIVFVWYGLLAYCAELWIDWKRKRHHYTHYTYNAPSAEECCILKLFIIRSKIRSWVLYTYRDRITSDWRFDLNSRLAWKKMVSRYKPLRHKFAKCWPKNRKNLAKWNNPKIAGGSRARKMSKSDGKLLF